VVFQLKKQKLIFLKFNLLVAIQALVVVNLTRSLKK
jgi:hypothetical protein